MNVNLDKYFKGQSKVFIICAGYFFVFIIGIIDFLAGPEINLAIFYLIPIFLVTLFVDKRNGYAISLASGIVLLLSELWEKNESLHPLIPYWNLISCTGIFLIVAFLLSSLKEIYLNLEKKVEDKTRNLTEEIIERKKIEIELQKIQEVLEKRVEERTVELSKSYFLLKTLSRKLVKVQEEERHNISRELHDEIGQILTGLKIILEISRNLPLEKINDNLNKAHVQVSELIAKVQDMSLDLRPSMLDDQGLLPTLLWHFDRYTHQTDIQVEFEYSGLENRFPPELETAAYRIVQEALTNVARHAKTKSVFVDLFVNQEKFDIQIWDEGIGFDVNSSLKTGEALGLTGMLERAVLLGGKLTIDSDIGKGTKVYATFPLTNTILEDKIPL
jgi:signal transduction histidine kinase